MLGVRAGAAGFLMKDLDLEVLGRALRAAFAGEAVVSRRFAKKLLDYVRHAPEPRALMPIKSTLTPREWEVMTLIASLKTTDQIAEALVLSTETVRWHVKHILRNSTRALARRRSRSRRRCAAATRLRRQREVQAVPRLGGADADAAAVTRHDAGGRSTARGRRRVRAAPGARA